MPSKYNTIIFRVQTLEPLCTQQYQNILEIPLNDVGDASKMPTQLNHEVEILFKPYLTVTYL